MMIDEKSGDMNVPNFMEIYPLFIDIQWGPKSETTFAFTVF